MSTLLDDPDRRTVPRWRFWEDAVRLGDVDITQKVRTPNMPNLDGLERARHDWEVHQSLPFAGDFLGVAYALGQADQAKDAANFVSKFSSGTSKAAHDLAQKILKRNLDNQNILQDPPSPNLNDRRNRINHLRNYTRKFQRNPLVYMDLAREYVALGQTNAAKKPVMTALALAPNNRFILRSASRFFLHINDPERAHDILRKAKRIKSDPWILAAEIAVASAVGRTSRLIRTGRNFVNSKDLPPFHLSELASALGTLEWNAGNTRLVKRFFVRALEKPTENVVAQAGWINRRLGYMEINPQTLDIPGAFEARAWANLLDSKWRDSLNAAELWQRDEPFSRRPAVFGSWLALVALADYKKAEDLARQGLIMHPDEFLLLNNLAVALAYMGKIDEAKYEFEKIKKEEAEGAYKPTYFATKGLIQFRNASIEEGRRFYQNAIKEAKERKDYRTTVWALLHFAREEFLYAPNIGNKLVKEALGNSEKLSGLDQSITSRLLDLISPTDK